MEDSITLRVRDGATELLFKVRRNTPLARVREAYTSKRGAEFSNVQFFIDGRQVSDADTAASLELDDSDVIEVGSGRENKIRQTLIEELEQRIGQSQTSVSQLRKDVAHHVGERDSAISSEMIDRALLCGIDAEFALYTSVRYCSWVETSGVAQKRSVQSVGVTALLEEQLNAFLNELERCCAGLSGEGDIDENVRERVMCLKTPKFVLEPLLAMVAPSGSDLSGVIQSSALFGKSGQRRRGKRERKISKRGEDEVASSTDVSALDAAGDLPYFLGLLVAKALVDGSLQSLLLAIASLFSHYRKDGGLILPVGNLLACLFEGPQSSQAHETRAFVFQNPFRTSLVSDRVSVSKSTASSSGSIEPGTEIAHLVDGSEDNDEDDDMLAQALALSLGEHMHPPQTQSEQTAAPAPSPQGPAVAVMSTFAALLHPKYGASTASTNGVPLLHVVVALLTYVSIAADRVVKDGLETKTSATDAPDVSPSMVIEPSKSIVHILEVLLSAIVLELQRLPQGDSYEFAVFAFKWASWIVTRLLKFCYKSYSSVDASIFSSLSFLVGFDVVSFENLSEALPFLDCFEDHAVRRSASEACACARASAADTDLESLTLLRDYLEISPSYDAANKIWDSEFTKNFITNRICELVVEFRFLGFKLAAYLQSAELMGILLASPNCRMSQERESCVSIEELCIERLGVATPLFSSNNDTFRIGRFESLFCGELSVLKRIQSLRIRVHFGNICDSVLDFASFRFNTKKCSLNIRVHEEGVRCVHSGPKAWVTVVTSRGLPPFSGLYEFTIRVDKCEKGHVFIGVVTADASCDTYIGGDKFGFGVIGTRAVWHNKSKTKSDYGQPFGSSSYVSCRYDSDAGRLYFSSNDADWVMAFDSLPREILYPAVSLYQKDDTVSLCALLTMKQKSAGNSPFGHITQDDWLIPFFKTVEGVVMRLLECAHNASGSLERCCFLSHPFITVLLPSLAAAIIKDETLPNESIRTTFPVLPSLIVLTRMFARAYESLTGAHDLSLCSGIDGQWVIKSSSGGPNLPAQEYTLLIDTSPAAAQDSGEGKLCAYGKPLLVFGAGKGLTSAVGVKGFCFGTRLMLTETWPQGVISDICARVSLDLNFFSGKFVDCKTGSSGTIEGERVGSGRNTTFEERAELSVYKVALLLSHACGKSISDFIRFSAFRTSTVEHPSLLSEKAEIVSHTTMLMESQIFSYGLPFVEVSVDAVQSFCDSLDGDAVWWRNAVFPSVETPSAHTPLSVLLEALRGGVGRGRLLDDYMVHHTGGSSILKLGGNSFTAARRLVLCSLVRHCGCVEACELETDRLEKSHKRHSERPTPILVEIWRASLRILESAIKSKQTAGVSYNDSAEIICTKAQLLLDTIPPRLPLYVSLYDNAHSSSDELSDEMSRILVALIEFFASPMCDVELLRSLMVEASMRASFRVAALRSFSLMFKAIPGVGECTGAIPPLSVIALQAGIVGYLSAACSNINGACCDRRSAEVLPCVSESTQIGHYCEGLEGMSNYLRSQIKSSFDVAYEHVAQFLLRATWAGDRDSQCLGLSSWMLKVLPQDHALLSKVGIFRILQTLLDETRSSLHSLGGFTAREGTGSVLSLGVKASKRLTNFALAVVHGLASQIAFSGDLVSISPLSSLQMMPKVLSGPDTLSLSLFDMLFAELSYGCSIIIATALNAKEASMGNEQNEAHMYRILCLLYSVASSKVCLKYLCSAKWINLLLNVVGCGGLAFQRKLMQLLRQVLCILEPENCFCFDGGLFRVKDDLSLGDEGGEEQCNENAGQRLVSFLFECINLVFPLPDTAVEIDVKAFLEHIRANRTAECISFEALETLRALSTHSKWRTVINSHLRVAIPSAEKPSSWSSIDTLQLALSAFSFIGGYSERFREGGHVVVNPRQASKDGDPNALKFSAPNYFTGTVVDLAHSTVEVALNSDMYAKSGAKTLKLITVDLSEVAPAPATEDFLVNIDHDVILSAFTVVRENLLTPLSQDWPKESTDIICRQLILTTVMLKSVLSLLRLERFGVQFLDTGVLESVISLASDEKYKSLSDLPDDQWLSLLDSYFLIKPCRVGEAACSAKKSAPDAAPSSRPVGLSPAGLVSAFGLGQSANIGRDVDPYALEQMTEIGIEREWAVFALRRCRNNIEIAINMCFEHGHEMAQLIAEDELLQQRHVQLNRAGSMLRRREDEGNERRPAGGMPSVAQLLAQSRRTLAADNAAVLRPLLDLGFPLSWSQRAMNAADNNVDSALGWILANGDNLVAEDESKLPVVVSVQESPPVDTLNVVLPSALSVIGGNATIDKDLTCRGTGSGFPSVGCRGLAVSSGKWYFECTILSAGCCQVGWADVSFQGCASEGQGVGDCSSSWAFDGYRSMLWNGDSISWGRKWEADDVLGCAVDMDSLLISFYLNGRGDDIGMGPAFGSFSFLGGVYPAASFNRGEKIVFNLSGPFKYPAPLGYSPFQSHIDTAVAQSESTVHKLPYPCAAHMLSDCMEELQGLDTLSGLSRYFSAERPGGEGFGHSRAALGKSRSLTKTTSDAKDLSMQLCAKARNVAIASCRRITLLCLSSEWSKSYWVDDARLLLLPKIISIVRICSLKQLQRKSALPSSPLISAQRGVLLVDLKAVLLSLLLNRPEQLRTLLLEQLEFDMTLLTVRDIAEELVADNASGTPYLPHTEDADLLSAPNLRFALWISEALVEISFLNHRTIEIDERLISNIVASWRRGMGSCNVRAKSFAADALSLLLQFIAVSENITSSFRGKIAKSLDVDRFRKGAVQLLDHEKHSTPACSEYLQNFVELTLATEKLSAANVSDDENRASMRCRQYFDDEMDCWFGEYKQAVSETEQGERYFQLLPVGAIVVRNTSELSCISNDTCVEPQPRLGVVASIASWEGCPSGSARVVEWADGEGEIDTVRWDVQGEVFDVLQVEIDSQRRITKVFPAPSLPPRNAVSLPKDKSFGLVLRTQKSLLNDETKDCEGVLEWPDMSASTNVKIERIDDYRFNLTEICLLSGSMLGWGERFGRNEFIPGTQFEISLNPPCVGGSFDLQLSGVHVSTVDDGRSGFRVTSSVSLQQSKFFWFDSQHKASALTLSRDSSVLTNSKGGKGLCFGHIGFSSGVHFWEFKIEQADHGSVFIGVSERPDSSDATGYNKWFGCGMVNNRTAFNTSQRTAGSIVYGDQFGSGDVVGVMLDMNRGRLSFFLDGMKYGEHTISDLGVAFDRLRHPDKVRTLYPVVGLQRSQDRVAITSKWLSVPGTRSEDDYVCISRIWNYIFSASTGSYGSIFKTQDWLLRDSFIEYRRMLGGTHVQVQSRCRSGCMALTLDTSVMACVDASIRLGLRQPLFSGDRFTMSMSCGRALGSPEEGVVLGAFRGRLWYRLQGDSVGEAASLAWFFAPFEMTGCSLLRRNQSAEALPALLASIQLPRIPEFHGGVLKIICRDGAIMRDGLEIDTAEIICTIDYETLVYAVERRVNSSNITRYHVHYNGVFGWVSESMRGGNENVMLQRMEVSEEMALDMKQCAAIEAGNRGIDVLYEDVKCLSKALATWREDAINKGFSVDPEDGDMSFGCFCEHLRTSEDKSSLWTVESDVILVDAMSRCANVDGVSPFNVTSGQLLRCLRSHDVPALAGASAQELCVRASVLKVVNQFALWALPYMRLKDLSDILRSEDDGTVLRIEVHRTFPQAESISDRSLFQYSGARRLRLLRRVLFSQTKRIYYDLLLESTTTYTPSHADEYEDPREIKQVKVNRVKATVQSLSLITNSVDRSRQTVMGQLYKELRNWSGANFRRSHVCKGHGGQKRGFKVKFIGEGVDDYGGPYRAVFEAIVDELMGDCVIAGHGASERCLLPLLIPSPNRCQSVGFNQDTFTLAPPPLSPTAIELLHFLGKLMGTAVRHNLPLALDIPMLLWRSVVSQPINRSHLEQIDVLAVKTLADVEGVGMALEREQSEGSQYPLDYRPEQWRDLTLTTHLSDGTRVPLVPGGDLIPLTISNWRDYVSKVESLRLCESQVPLQILLDGIGQVIPLEVLSLFTAAEVRQLFTGDRRVDVEHLRRNTDYENVDPKSRIVTDFWEVLVEMTDDQRTLFLRFVWARSRMPTSTQGESLNFKLQIDNRENADMYLPHAQTCFFTLTLPHYSSKAILRQKLLYAIENSPNMDADVQLHSAEGWDI